MTRQKGRDYLLSAVSMLLVLAVWEGGVRLFRLPIHLVPSPAQVLAAAIEHWP